MNQPIHHWLFLFALLCRLLAGEQAMADMSVAMPEADCNSHAMMLMHATHGAVSATHEMHAGMHHSVALTAGEAMGTTAHAACDSHDCCPTGACDCACVHLTLLLPTTVVAPMVAANAASMISWLQPPPQQRPERVFRPPA